MIILGIDPGNTTGYAVLQYDEETKKSHWLTLGEWRGKEQVVSAMDHNFHPFTPDIIAIEDFELRPDHIGNNIRRTKGFVPLPVPKLIGQFERWAHVNNKVFEEQSPAEKPFGYKLCNIPYKKDLPGQHIHDAQSHAAIYVHRKLGGFAYG